MSRAAAALDVARGRTHPLDAVDAALPRALRGRLASRPARDAAAPEVVLSPHRDDAVLSCWTALTRRGDVAVVNVFTGVPPGVVAGRYDRIAGASDAAALARRRAGEDGEALARAGRASVDLDFLEAGHRRRAPAARRVLAALAARVPAAGAVLAPAAVGLHPDHLLVRRAALRLAEAGMPVRFYADVPYCVVYGWPAWVTGEAPSPHLDVDAHWAPALEPLRAAGVGLRPRVHRLDDDARQAKLAALRTYASQYPTLSRGPLDVLAHPAVLGFEVTWDVTPPRGGRGSTRTP